MSGLTRLTRVPDPNAAGTTAPGFTGRQRSTMFVLIGAGFMLSVDFSILNVALPEVGDGVGLGVTGLPWISTAYVLPAAGFTLLFGRMADLFGRRRLFLSGLVLLICASLVGGLAADPAMLLTARVLQGVATAMAIPAALSLLTTSFPEGALRDRVLGLNGALLSGGFATGALVGGTLITLLGWRAAFLINIPVAVVILLVTPSLINESRTSDRRELDLPGAVSVSGGLLAVTYAVIETNVVVGVVGALLLIGFWIIEHRVRSPLAPQHILRRRTVKCGNYAAFVVMAVEPAMIFLITLYLQNTLKLSPLTTGLVFGLPGLASVAAGVIAGRLIGRFGTRHVLTVGMTVQGLAIVPLVFVDDHRLALALVLPALFIGFFGHVTSIVAFTVTATSGLPNDEQGLATGLVSMTQQVAVTVGIPTLSSIAATQSTELAGMHLALGAAAAFILAGVILIWFGLGPRSERRATITAAVHQPMPQTTPRRVREPLPAGAIR
jgi:MFS family permease